MIIKLLFAILSIYSSLNIQEKPILAVINLRPLNISKDDALIITGFLQEELYYSNNYVLVDRSIIENLLVELKFQQSGLCDTECAVQLGKQLAANKVITGSVGKLGNSYTLQISLIDIETSSVEKPVSIIKECKLEGLPYYINELVKKLVGQETIPNKKGNADPINSTQPNISDFYNICFLNDRKHPMDLYLKENSIVTDDNRLNIEYKNISNITLDWYYDMDNAKNRKALVIYVKNKPLPIYLIFYDYSQGRLEILRDAILRKTV